MFGLRFRRGRCVGREGRGGATSRPSLESAPTALSKCPPLGRSARRPGDAVATHRPRRPTATKGRVAVHPQAGPSPARELRRPPPGRLVVALLHARARGGRRHQHGTPENFRSLDLQPRSLRRNRPSRRPSCNNRARGAPTFVSGPGATRLSGLVEPARRAPARSSSAAASAGVPRCTPASEPRACHGHPPATVTTRRSGTPRAGEDYVSGPVERARGRLPAGPGSPVCFGVLRGVAPPLHLRPALDAVWAYDDPAAGMARHLVLPDGCVDLIVRWARPDEGARARMRPALLVAGPSATSNLIQVAAGVRFLGARLAPGAARAVLGGEPAALIGAVSGAGIAGVPPDLTALAGRLADAAGRGTLRRRGFEAEIAALIAAAGPRGVPPGFWRSATACRPRPAWRRRARAIRHRSCAGDRRGGRGVPAGACCRRRGSAAAGGEALGTDGRLPARPRRLPGRTVQPAGAGVRAARGGGVPKHSALRAAVNTPPARTYGFASGPCSRA